MASTFDPLAILRASADRRAAELMWRHGATFAEIARALRVPPSTVASWLDDIDTDG